MAGTYRGCICFHSYASSLSCLRLLAWPAGGSLPPQYNSTATFPTQNSEPPTSTDMTYVPMSSFGPESSLAPATTSDRGELNYVYSEPARQDSAFPSPFAVRPDLSPSSWLHLLSWPASDMDTS